MPSPQAPDAAAFPLKAVAWSLGLFALLRSPWVEGSFVLPLTRWQQSAAEFYAGPPTGRISVTTECSGTDVLALCLAAILAWPVSWRTRLAGAFGGIAVILALNTVRIGTLGRAAASPALFETLHLQVWPAILVVATAAYVFGWMRAGIHRNEPSAESPQQASLSSLSVRRFAALSALTLIAFAFCGPWIARSETLLAAGAWIAGGAALTLTAMGVSASAAGNVLTTSRGTFMVTPECLATALVPLYVAAVLAAPINWRFRIMALLAAPPAFATLAIARVLLLALPSVLVSSPLFLVHGFYQMVLAVMVVALVSWWLEPPGARRRWRASMRASLSLAAAAVFAMFAGSALTNALLGILGAITPLAPHTLAELTGPGDAQGALATLFAFQASFLLALGLTAVAGWPRLLTAFTALFAAQVVFLVVVANLVDLAGAMPHALLLRAFAVAVPAFLALAIFRVQPRTESLPARMVLHGPA